MKIGDPVSVITKHGIRYGIVIVPEKKKFMVGAVIEVLVGGKIQTFLKEKVSLIEEVKNES